MRSQSREERTVRRATDGDITLEDLDGQIDGMCYAETFAVTMKRYPDAVQTDGIVFVHGKVDQEREIPSLLVNEVIPLGEA